ncbi:MAG: SDR family oxidoreductase [Verrucomicrobia bacterium]|nr:SDR family oxidoreductase [Verrucomicrobiota bacterium]
MRDHTKLQNRIALITGAASGIGRATAELFAAEGARVVVADLDDAGASETVQRITQAGNKAIAVHADVSNAAQVEAAVARTIEAYGRIDILHNNAAMFLAKFLEDMSETEWDRLMAVNLKSIFLGVKHVVPHMKRQGGGCILNTASVESFLGQPMSAAYVASKGAVALLTKSLALDYARFNIRVNCIAPGAVETPMMWKAINAFPDPAAVEKLERAHVPIGRFLRPEEIAQAALYLASDAAAGVTGTALVVDGGYLAGYMV